MKSGRREFLKRTVFLSTGSVVFPEMVFSTSGKRVSLIGDSVRMGYQWHASLYLKGEAEVWSPGENTMHTVHILANAINEFL